MGSFLPINELSCSLDVVMQAIERRQTPSGQQKIHLQMVEPESDILLSPSAYAAEGRILRTAYYHGLEPEMVSQIRSIEARIIPLSNGEKLYAPFAKYVVYDHSCIFQAMFRGGSRVDFDCFVCHPDYRPSHPIRTVTSALYGSDDFRSIFNALMKT